MAKLILESWLSQSFSMPALEAKRQIKFPFTVRILDEDDSLLSLISPKGKYLHCYPHLPRAWDFVLFIYLIF